MTPQQIKVLSTLAERPWRWWTSERVAYELAQDLEDVRWPLAELRDLGLVAHGLERENGKPRWAWAITYAGEAALKERKAVAA